MDRTTRPATIMPHGLFEQIISEISAWERPPVSILLSPNAEVLTDPLFEERLNTLRRHDVAKVTTLLTNGQFLGEAATKAILRAGIFQIMPGFDGASKPVYEAHRVRCNYERVLANIRSFAKLRDASPHKTRIILKFVRTPRNDHEVVQAYNLFNAFLDSELDRFNDALATDWGNAASTAGNLYYYPKMTEGRRLGFCNYYEDGLMIQADGKIGACCWDHNLTISDGGLGDANDTPLLDIWQGQRRQVLQKAFHACDENIPDPCKTCMMIYEWDPIPDGLVRFDDSTIESRGPTSFMCLFRGAGALAEPLQ
jgi:radical SAM protein with 4Fe4S-binding SPASM domain